MRTQLEYEIREARRDCEREREREKKRTPAWVVRNNRITPWRRGDVMMTPAGDGVTKERRGPGLSISGRIILIKERGVAKRALVVCA